MSLIRALAKVSSNTLVSRVLGFVRDLVLAHVFGANSHTDAFFVAFKIPNFMRRLFAEGAFATAFVPVLSEYKVKRSFAELKAFVDTVGGSLGLVLLGVTLVGVAGAPLLVMVFAPGFADDPGKLELAGQMLRLTFPYLLFISLTAFAGGILNAYNRFAIPAFTPVLLNLSLIGCALWLAPRMQEPIVALAWGVLIAGIAQLTFQLPFLNKLRLVPRLRVNFRDEGVRRILRLMLPALFGVSVTQISLLLDTLIASFLISGSISWLYYSDRLMEFPLGIIGVALGTVILPNLSHRHAEASPEGFSRAIDWGLRWVLLLGLPASVGLALLAEPIIATLFQSAVFTPADVAMTQRSLMAYALGLLAFISIKVLATGYYARQDTKTPVKIAIKAMAANMLLNILLVFPLAHAGLALATSLSGMLNAFLLYRGLRLAQVYLPLPGWRERIGRVLLATLLMGLLLWFGAKEVGDWVEIEREQRIWGLLLLVGAGGGSYFLLLWLLGIGKRDFTDQGAEDR
ncbi:MAG: murein biosynthesis integral membrane protein MurJ [Gammaproteobacteria bacterium SHHR-1]